MKEEGNKGEKENEEERYEKNADEGAKAGGRV